MELKLRRVLPLVVVLALAAQACLAATVQVPFFSQQDPRWKDEPLGPSSVTIGSHGCALTAATMVAKYYGVRTDPLSFNNSLTSIGGIGSSGDLDWAKVVNASGGKITSLQTIRDLPDSDYFDRIAVEINQGCPVIAAVKTAAVQLHYILFWASEEGEFSFYDPADPSIKVRTWPVGYHGTYTQYPTRSLRIYRGNLPETAFSGGGSGTQTDPYVITDVYQLQEMNKDLSAWYVLGNDIDASVTLNWNERKGFIPVGDNSVNFRGHLDGQGHTITGLYINRPDTDYVGLFGYRTGGSQVISVGLENIAITGRDMVGGLAGHSWSCQTKRCYTKGTVTGHNYVGGLMDCNMYNEITECYSLSSVSGNAYVGG